MWPYRQLTGDALTPLWASSRKLGECARLRRALAIPVAKSPSSHKYRRSLIPGGFVRIGLAGIADPFSEYPAADQ
jgi:hypothetical protein